jgi:murein DD-endopeptidase MepM/ murein hydrolase activator NlpD
MAGLFYPLEVMRLRSDEGIGYNPVGATFGKDVRRYPSGAPKKHQGWDLYAPVGTAAYAISDGVVAWTHKSGDYGLQLLLQFTRNEPMTSGEGDQKATSIFAFYAHLSKIYVKAWDVIKGGQLVALTGISGEGPNAPNPKYPHLHFEIRTDPGHPTGLDGRLDPSVVLGGQLLSCNTEQIGGTDVAQMISVQRHVATPINRTY